MTSPRVLAVMGSGETAPTMAKVHRALFDRFEARTVPAAIVDTPYGFQENADELSARTLEFFATSVGNPVEVASFRSAAEDAVTAATAVARLREARYVMAGPGSPSYALRQWAGTGIPDALGEKLAGRRDPDDGERGGADPGRRLDPGLRDLQGRRRPDAGSRGSTCSARRPGCGPPSSRTTTTPRAAPTTPASATWASAGCGRSRRCSPTARSCSASTATPRSSSTSRPGEASVAGLGGVTVRVDGRSTRFGAGATLSIEALGEAARALAAGDAAEAVHDAALAGGPADAADDARRRPLRDAMADLEGTFVAALEHGETREAVAALLDLDSAIAARLRQGEDSPDLDNASAMFRSLIVRLGDGAAAGTETHG